jgi:hypothetical protein
MRGERRRGGSAGWRVTWAIAIAIPGCGDDSGGEGTSVTTATTMSATTADASTGGDTSTSDASVGDSSSTSTTADPTATTASPETTGGPSPACDPAMAPFIAQDPALPEASIHLDFDVPSCAAASLAGEDPQVVLDVKDTGLVDATLFGLEIVSSSTGQAFMDSPMGDSQVIDLPPDLPITLEATRIPDGQAVTISFEIFSTGPTILDAQVVFG